MYREVQVPREDRTSGAADVAGGTRVAEGMEQVRSPSDREADLVRAGSDQRNNLICSSSGRPLLTFSANSAIHGWNANGKNALKKKPPD